MPVEGISMTTVFSLVAAGLALALSTYIGGYYLRPIFDADSLLGSVAYDLATLHDLAYTMPGTATLKYYGPGMCKWNSNKAGDDLNSFYCLDPSTILIREINVKKEYLLVYDDIYLKYDSNNPSNTNWIIEGMGANNLSQAIGYPRISFLTVEIPYYNRGISRQTDTATGQISYGSLAAAPFAGSYTDNAMAAADSDYGITVTEHSFQVSKTKVGGYYYTLADVNTIPQEISLFLSQLAATYLSICRSETPNTGYYNYFFNRNITYDELIDSPATIMLSKGFRAKAYSSGIPMEKLFDAWTFNSGGKSLLGKNDLTVHSAELSSGLFSNAYKFSSTSYLDTSISSASFAETSISLWINPSRITNTDILRMGSFTIKILNNKIAVESPQAQLSSMSSISTNKWQHVVLSYGKTEAKLFINGKLESQKSYTQGSETAVSSIKIGSTFEGLIDDVKIFKEELSESEINKIYIYPANNEICSETIRLTNDIKELHNELYDYWSFDSNTISALNEIELTRKNVPSIQEGAIKFGSSDFGCGPDDICYTNSYLSSGINPKFDSFSISFYLKPDAITSPDTYRYILSNNRNCCSSETAGYGIRLTQDNKISFHFATSQENSAAIISNNAAPANEWTHVLISYSSGRARIYINGELDIEQSTNVYYIGDSYYNLTVGALAYQAPTNYPYYGFIDELKIFNKELSIDEAEYVYNNRDKLEIKPIFEEMAINTYVNDYCFNIEELIQRTPCENVDQVIFSDNFIKVINELTNYFAGWNSCIYPFFSYDSENKEITLNATLAESNIIRGGCDLK